ncbi:MAG: TIGR03943 family protein [Actinoplanes sp.]
MSRLTQAVLLLLFGGAILRASLTDLHLRYVKEGMRPFLIAAGLVLVIAAVMTLWHSYQDDRAAEHAPDPTDPTRPAEPEAGPPAQALEPDAGAPGQSHDHEAGPAGASAHSAGSPAVASEHGGAPLAGAPGSPADASTAEDHDHEHHSPLVGWLLIVPVLGLLLVAPPALGAFSAKQSGTITAAPASDSVYPALPPGDPATISLLDYASRALFDEGRSLAGRDLKLTGFITPGADGRPMLARIVLSCCAADGRPIKVGLTGRVPDGVPGNTWVEIIGVYRALVGKDTLNGADVAYLEVKTWHEIPQPKQPYA